MKKGTTVKERKAVYQTKPDVVTIPVTVFETAESKEELEDWLLANDREFIEKMRKVRKDDLAGKFISWEEVKKKLNIK